MITSDWEFGQMMIFLPIIVTLYYFYYLYEKRRMRKDIANFTRQGFHHVVDFKKQPSLRVNQLSNYLPVSRSPRYVFMGKHESRDIEIVISQSLVLPQLSFSFFKTAFSQEYQGAVIVKGVNHIPDFFIIPKEFGDSWFVKNSEESESSLPDIFTDKYHIVGSLSEVLKLPNAFFEYIADRNSRLFVESKNNSLAIGKVGEVIHNGWAINNMLVRSDILISLLDEESEFSRAM